MRIIVGLLSLLMLTGCTAYLIGGSAPKPEPAAAQNCDQDESCDRGQ
ncbi:MAG: hypothetical protein IIB75_04245 [Proteobacteria bacterium]|nr:hypothetical protein [Pseudomonadota bacterium]